MDVEASPPYFAGELFLTLAAEGRLVVEAVRADETIAELESTLAVIRRRLRVMAIWQAAPDRRLDEVPDEMAPDVVQAVFGEQLAPGRLEAAAIEIPKYIEALRRARRPELPAERPEENPKVF